jgi:hypothetical protein
VQCKKNFNTFAPRTQIPTGNPNITPPARGVKAIKELRVEKSEGVTGSEEEIFSPDDIEEEEGMTGIVRRGGELSTYKNK